MTEQQNQQIPFNGDYQQAVNAYTSLQSQVTPLQQQLAEVKKQNEELSAKMNQLSTQSTPTPKPEGNAGGDSLYDWTSGTLRTDDGQVNPSLYSAMQKAGAQPEHVDRLVQTVESAGEMAAIYKDWAIKNTVGDEQKMTQLMEWGKQNTSNPVVKAASHLIQDVRTLPDGLALLKQQAEAGGFQFTDQQTQQTIQSNEPSPLPQTGTGLGGVSPLTPGTPEANRAVKEAMDSKDPAKMKDVESRLQAGMKRQ